MPEDLRELIKEGIIYEDDFIELYMKLIRDEGFLEYFGAGRGEAEKLLNILTSESREHKKSLVEIINSL
jgi:hypothetical protein